MGRSTARQEWPLLLLTAGAGKGKKAPSGQRCPPLTIIEASRRAQHLGSGLEIRHFVTAIAVTKCCNSRPDPKQGDEAIAVVVKRQGDGDHQGGDQDEREVVAGGRVSALGRE